MFLIYVNDVPSAVRCKLLLYADDSALIVSGTNTEEIQNILSSELESIREWLIDNQLSLHLGKTESILFGSKRNPAGTITLNPRWIHVMAWCCFHVDIWFYLKIESTSGFPRWFHVMFSTLIPRVFHVESTCFQRWINVMFSTLNQRQDPTWFPHWYLVLYESWFHVQFSTLNLRNVLNVEST